MPLTATFNWNVSGIRERVVSAVVDGLDRVGTEARQVWEETAPISNDPRTRGDLRKMFRAPTVGGEVNVALILHAYSRESIHVEYGTFKDPEQAPLRRTAGIIIPGIAGHIRAAMMEL